MLDTQKIIDS